MAHQSSSMHIFLQGILILWEKNLKLKVNRKNGVGAVGKTIGNDIVFRDFKSGASSL